MLRITGQDARHIERVLRHRVGDSLTVCDGNGRERQCAITAFSGGEVLLSGGAPVPSPVENPFRLALYMGLPKGDKAERVLKAAVELGVNDVTFFCPPSVWPGRTGRRAKAGLNGIRKLPWRLPSSPAGRCFLPCIHFWILTKCWRRPQASTGRSCFMSRAVRRCPTCLRTAQRPWRLSPGARAAFPQRRRLPQKPQG